MKKIIIFILCICFVGCSRKEIIEEKEIIVTTYEEDITTPSRGDIYAHIVCDAIGLDKDIYYGDDEKILKKALGQYCNSSLFGEGDVILVAGHNGTHFKALRNIEIGHILEVTTEYGTYTYEVYKTDIRNMEDFKEEELHQDHEELIMYTCYPFDSLHTNQRFFVYCHLV